MLHEEFENYTPDQIKAGLQRLHNSSKRAYGLVTNLLEWSRLERGLLACTPGDCSLDELVHQNLQIVSAHAEQKHVRMRRQIPAGTRVYADVKMVDAVIRNLLSNAVKFTDAGGRVEITARQKAQHVELTVSDTGIGMSAEMLDTLFTIDQHTVRPGTAGEEGTGLGMILCKEFVEKNGGRLRVESQPGQGSTFTVSLPRP